MLNNSTLVRNVPSATFFDSFALPYQSQLIPQGLFDWGMATQDELGVLVHLFHLCTLFPAHRSQCRCGRDNGTDLVRISHINRLSGCLTKSCIHIAQSFFPTIDCFASRINTQHRHYAARRPDPFAKIIDAFSFNWGTEKCYIFPPFSLIA